MLSPETLETYRRMTPSQRLRLTLDMLADNERFLLMGDEAQVNRKFALLNQRNDERNQALLDGLKRAEQRRQQPESDSS